MEIIVNADDFGSSSNINRAILEAFKKELISSSTIMVNMPSFEEACSMVHRENLHGKIGIHLNLTAGKPITKEMSESKKFCDRNGYFKQNRQSLFYLNRKGKEIVYNEFNAQLNKMLENNIIPTHIDSHHHYHTEWSINNCVEKLAIQNNINYIRLTRNMGKGIKGLKKVYKNLLNYKLQIKGLNRVKYFGSIDDALTLSSSCLKNIEIMVHPQLNKQSEIIDSNREKLNEEIKKIKEHFKIDKFTSY